MAAFQAGQRMTSVGSTMLRAAVLQALAARRIDASGPIGSMAFAATYAVVAISRGNGVGLQAVVDEWFSAISPRIPAR